jgi:hypothetical protein
MTTYAKFNVHERRMSQVTASLTIFRTLKKA